jgi:sugar lactone lactonase YvrE
MDAAAQQGTAFEVFATLDQGPGNIAVTPDGRVIVSQHQFYNPSLRVVEVLGDGSTRPFPNEEWAGPPGPDGIGMQAVLGIRAAPDGVVWMLDNGSKPPRLIAWDTQADQLSRIVPIPPPASVDGSFLNDFAYDARNGAIYIADIGRGPEGGAIVVINLRTAEARRLLAGHPSTSAENVPMLVDDKPVRVEGADGRPVDARVAVNPITIDAEYEWVYFGAMHGTALHRVRTADLLDASLSEAALAARIERFGPKPPSDGISIDNAGNVYVTDVQANGIGVTRPDGRYQLLFSDPERLSWPDAISAGPDGFMYVAVNKLHRSAALNAGVNDSQPPYYIVRFQPLAPVSVGR